ncbi:uncharacterized protein LOC126686947 [Mercurialis annua]|uniref:uncharacterized protein LOC126686947 n=1 Tax=Mercurialis annua TaxID=3986 RepID=UPI00215E1F53|nr:uncharacterized protein LOC126686947 [Mercurialis annua]
MGSGSGKRRKNSSRRGVSADNNESVRKSNVQHQEVLKLEVVDGKHIKKSSRQESYADQEGELIFQSNLNSPTSTSSLSLNLLPSSTHPSVSINYVPSSSHSSLSINLPPFSHSSLSVRLHSSPSSHSETSSSASSNMIPQFKSDDIIDDEDEDDDDEEEEDEDDDDEEEEEINACAMHDKRFRLRKGCHHHTLTCPVLDFIHREETYPLMEIDSTMNIPPVMQVMHPTGGEEDEEEEAEDEEEAEEEGYDPSRIPSSVFEVKEHSSPVEWSVASNDSLFSLKLGKSNSLPREAILTLAQQGSAEFAFTPPPPIKMVDDIASDMERLEAADKVVHIGDEIKIDAAENIERNDKKKKKQPSPISCGSGDSAATFAFPILEDEKKAISSPEPIGAKQHLQDYALTEQQPKPPPLLPPPSPLPSPPSPSPSPPPPPVAISIPEAKIKSKSKAKAKPKRCWFCCFFSCSSWNCSPCRSCCSSLIPCSRSSSCRRRSCFPSRPCCCISCNPCCCVPPRPSCSCFSCRPCSCFPCSSCSCSPFRICRCSSCNPLSCFSCGSGSCCCFRRRNRRGRRRCC